MTEKEILKFYLFRTKNHQEYKEGLMTLSLLPCKGIHHSYSATSTFQLFLSCPFFSVTFEIHFQTVADLCVPFVVHIDLFPSQGKRKDGKYCECPPDKGETQKKKTSRDGVTPPYKLLSKLLSSVNTAYTAFKVV